jgi:myo-inositol-1(or 4)-monophosphatase
MSSDYSHFLEVALEAAAEAGSILLAEADKPKKISYKGEVDIVTEADRRSEEAVASRLRRHFPKHEIVGEEMSGEAGAAALGDAPFCWHIDPLDGTTNFAHGYPCYAVSIALCERGEPRVGVVFNPARGELFHATAGGGAYLDRKRIRVSRVERLNSALLCTGFPTHLRAQNPNIHYYWRYTLASHGVRRDGSAALDLCYVAAGRFDGFWEFGLKTWDTAAGALMVREAGGMVSDFAGMPYLPGGPEVLATNGIIHEEMRAVARDIAHSSLQVAGERLR